MAKCSPASAHKWLLLSRGSKVFVHCQLCGSRFQFTNKFDGAPYRGDVPEEFK